LRRISEVGKGAYMIGSSGWSYHHKNPKYDRKNVVVRNYIFRVFLLEREKKSIFK
jgi:hypothetical protein